MKIIREQDGYAVDLSGVDHKWQHEDSPGFATPSKFIYGPVTRFLQIKDLSKSNSIVYTVKPTVYKNQLFGWIIDLFKTRLFFQ